MFNTLLNTSQISNVTILKTKQKIYQNKTLCPHLHGMETLLQLSHVHVPNVATTESDWGKCHSSCQGGGAT